ncbi:MAG TPA: TonB-dependent receptor [Ignavibacteriales bacterium]|nr:TonB-dependent receptor [Ignavibacteriales bacterium]
MARGKFQTGLFMAAVMAVILPLFFSNGSYAQTGGKIAGKVVDAGTHEPLPGVTIRVEGQKQGAVTDVEGDYFILNVSPGTVSLRATMVGYQGMVKTNVEVSANHTTNVNFNLEATVVSVGQDVVVTAERPLVEKDQTSTRHYVEATDIAARPTTQLTEILTTLPGIDMNNGQVVVRRGSLDQVSFLIDGIRARNPLDFQPYTNINITSIQELEIITGGFNAEYGEAQSGVFNIITKEGGNTYSGTSEFRWTPPGLHHWGTAFYDYSTTRYWENTHARHLQWWIDHPDQWVDPTGVPGNDPRSQWTPEQAYQDYMQTHQPLTDYTNESTYQEELSFGGPVPFIKDMFFFASGKYRTAPPITGNSIRSMGKWFDGTAKLTYRVSDAVKLMFSGFYGQQNTNQGMEYMDIDWVGGYGLKDKYAYYDFPGYPENRTDGQTLQYTHVLGVSTFYHIQLNRVHRYRSQGTFPNDPNGWDLGVPVFDRLRAVDQYGNPVPEGFSNLIGLHTTGYYYRGHDNNTDMSLSGDLTSQLNKAWQIKTGGDLTYYTLQRFQETKAWSAIEDHTYHPYEGNLYVQNKLEFGGLIMNIGLRFDFYNANDKVYLNPFDPFDLITSAKEGRAPNPQTEPTKTYGQLSPRIGISHPISEKTVLHFSYGHFFQRASFGNYGEGTDVTGILNTYIIDSKTGIPAPYNLGNRDLKPRKTVAYELGIEHNFGGLVADATAFYKDITKTIRTITVYTLDGGRYLTSGNGDYGDAKGVEISITKPLTGYWGGYLNYSWSTGINGYSGDPTTIAPPGSKTQVSQNKFVGDQIVYDPSRLKFGFTVATPADLSLLAGIFSNIQFSLDYQVYYPNSNIPDDVFPEAGQQYMRSANRNADIRIRKELDFKILRPAIFLELRNAFNDKWVNLNAVKGASPEDRSRFINSGLTVFPEKSLNGAPFPDVIAYRNLPRQIVFGLAVSF